MSETATVAEAPAPAGDWADAILAEEGLTTPPDAPIPEAKLAPEPPKADPKPEAKAEAKQDAKVAGQLEKALDLTPAQALEAAKALRHRVKVDGQEFDVDYDELIRNYQIRKHSERATTEARQLAEKIRAVPDKARQDLVAALRDLGMDEGEIVEQMEKAIYQRIQQAQMTPEQREAAQAKEELARLKAEREAEAKAREQESASTETTRFVESTSGELLAEAKRYGLAGETARDVMQVAVAEMIAARRAGYDLPAAVAMREAKQKFDATISGSLRNLEPDALIERLGEEGVEKLRKALVARVQSKVPARVEPSTPEDAPSKPKAKPRTDREAREAWEKEVLAKMRAGMGSI